MQEGRGITRAYYMTQHFLKSSRLRDFTAFDAGLMSEEEAHWMIVEARWGSREQLCCPKCGTIRKHYYRIKQKRWRCADCGDYFSVTTGTPFQDRKMSHRKLLIGIMHFIHSANGISHHALSRHLDVQVKTAQAFVGKLREAIYGVQPKIRMSGTVQIDGGYFGGRPRSGRVRKKSPEAIAKHVEEMLKKKAEGGKRPRPKSSRANWKRRQKRRVIMVLRELFPEKGKGARVTIVAVCQSENETDAISLASHYVAPGAQIMTDENPAYNRLSIRYQHDTVEHAVEFSTIDGINDNQAESYFSRLRRHVLGVAHRIEPKYMADIAIEMAWREDMRRSTEREKLGALFHAIFTNGLSQWWRCYWQGYHRNGEILWRAKA